MKNTLLFLGVTLLGLPCNLQGWIDVSAAVTFPLSPVLPRHTAIHICLPLKFSSLLMGLRLEFWARAAVSEPLAR